MTMYAGSWRNYSTQKSVLLSKTIRSRFFEYFVDKHDHRLVQSASVFPYLDSTIPFVNAGMCQFKKVFTGEDEVDFCKAANSQKCIRIGGKHNDLSVVGFDSYHHTFFEMLGNWSFGSYSKREACKLAWELLTTPPYNIPPQRLFVTYFGGDEHLKLPADEEIRSIWLDIGIPPNRILSFGAKENFWEMGLTGPCGTCTEIHVSLSDELCCRTDLVNKNHPFLAELWNIVFINYNKTESSLEKLPKEFVDTGMGFERLTALLQGKLSNYDTDLFVPLFDRIMSTAGAPPYSGTFGTESLDTSYRCLADFSRMITVAITDNVFPDVNPKLRRILRKALYIGESEFNYHSPAALINELSCQVAETFHNIFPEIGEKLNQVKLVVEHENRFVENLAKENAKSWLEIKSKYPALKSFSFIEYPNLPLAFEYLLQQISKSKSENIFTGDLITHLYETYGVDKPVVEHLARNFDFQVNWEKVEQSFENMKEQSRQYSMATERVKTDDSPKYHFRRNDTGHYEFPKIHAKLQSILRKEDINSIMKVTAYQLKSKMNADVSLRDNEVVFVFDVTNFFTAEDGSCCDKGEILFKTEAGDVHFMVNRTKKIDELIFHYASIIDDTQINIKKGCMAELKIDAVRRMDIMRNYTAAFIANSILKDLFPVAYCKYGQINEISARLICRVLGKEFNFVQDKNFIEQKINEYISACFVLEKSIVTSSLKLASCHNVALTSCLFYPSSSLQVISMLDDRGNTMFREAFGGIHLSNVADIGNFEIIKLKQKPSRDFEIILVTGKQVDRAAEIQKAVQSKTEKFKIQVNHILKKNPIDVREILKQCDDISRYFHEVFHKISQEKLTSNRTNKSIFFLDSLHKKLVDKLFKFPRTLIIEEISSRIRDEGHGQMFVVHFCLLQYRFHKFQWFKREIVKKIGMPTMLFNFHDRFLTGITYVPQTFVTNDFNAEIWMKAVITEFGFNVHSYKDAANYCFTSVPFYDNQKTIYPFIELLTQKGSEVAEKLMK